MGTVIVIGIIICAVVVVIIKLVKNKKEGKGNCSCGNCTNYQNCNLKCSERKTKNDSSF